MDNFTTVGVLVNLFLLSLSTILGDISIMSFLVKLKSIVPLQLFSVKSTSKPKADINLLVFITLVAYGIGLGTFVAIYVTQRHSYTTETSIETSDISNNEWTCSMASVVTQSITINSSEPIEAYNLMSINELKGDCINTLYGLNPCGNISSILLSPGTTSTDYFLSFYSTSAVSSLVGNVFYFASRKPDDVGTYQAYRYDYDSNTLTPGRLGADVTYEYPNFFDASYVATNSVAVNTDGEGLYVGMIEEAVSIFSFEGESMLWGGFCDIQGGCLGCILTNDNHYNPYLLTTFQNDNSTGYSNRLLRATDTLQLLTTLETQLTVQTMAVYNSHKDPIADFLTVYYNQGESVYIYQNYTSTRVFSGMVGFLHLSSTENKV